MAILIIVHIDNKKLLAQISSEILKESKFTIEASIIVKKLKRGRQFYN